MQAVAIRDRSAPAALLVSHPHPEAGVSVEQRHTEAVRRVHEPGIGVRQRVEVLPVAALEAEAEVLALAEEIARRKLRLYEEAGALGVAAAELHVVLPLFGSLHGHVDRLLL